MLKNNLFSRQKITKLLSLKFNSISSIRYFSDKSDESSDADSPLFDDFNRKANRPFLNQDRTSDQQIYQKEDLLDQQTGQHYSPLKRLEHNLSVDSLNNLKEDFNKQFSKQVNSKGRLGWIETNHYQIKEQQTLESLGLDKYAELFKENRTLNSQLTEELETERVSFFEKFLEQREFKELTVEMYDELIDSDEKREEIKQILRAYELEKYNTSHVPTELSVLNMKHLLNYSKKEQETHILYLYKREAAKAVRELKREVDKVNTYENLQKKHESATKRSGLEFNKDGAPLYAKWKNTFFISFNRASLRKESDRRVRDACLFGPKLVIDFGYSDEHIYKRQTFSTLTTQLIFLFSEVHHSKIPYHLNFCNLDKSRPIFKFIEENLKFMTQRNFLHNVTSQSYLDLFPKEDLIYLTSDSPKKMEYVDPEKVYIVGGYCDKFDRGPHSIQKAKSEGIQTMKLPLEDFFFFKQDRILSMNLVVGILEKYLETNNWRSSVIGKVPVRKLKTPDEVYLEQIRQVKKYFSKRKHFNKQNPEERVFESFSDNIYKPQYDSSQHHAIDYSDQRNFKQQQSYSKPKKGNYFNQNKNYIINDERNKF